MAVEDTLVMILAGGEGKRLYPLTRDRAKPAVPFGGRYRIIYFVINNVINCVKELGYIIKGLTYSSIKGPAGNIEYLIWISTTGIEAKINIDNTIDSAHAEL